MKQFWSDLLQESAREDKFSTKKFWGHICMTLISVSYILDGLNFYEINVHLFDSFLIAGTTLIGINTVAKFFDKKQTKKNETEQN